MGRFIFFAVIVLLAWGFWRYKMSGRTRSEAPSVRPQEPAPEKMLACAHCGAMTPISNGVAREGRFYCSQAHAQAHDGA